MLGADFVAKKKPLRSFAKQHDQALQLQTPRLRLYGWSVFLVSHLRIEGIWSTREG